MINYKNKEYYEIIKNDRIEENNKIENVNCEFKKKKKFTEQDVKALSELIEKYNIGKNFACFGGAFARFANETIAFNKKEFKPHLGIHMNDYLFNNDIFENNFIKLIHFSRWHILAYLSNNKLYVYKHSRYLWHLDHFNEWKNIEIPTDNEITNIQVVSCNYQGDIYFDNINKNKMIQNENNICNEKISKDNIFDPINIFCISLIDNQNNLYLGLNVNIDSNKMNIKQIKIVIPEKLVKQKLEFNVLFVSLPELNDCDIKNYNVDLKYSTIFELSYNYTSKRKKRKRINDKYLKFDINHNREGRNYSQFNGAYKNYSSDSCEFIDILNKNKNNKNTENNVNIRSDHNLKNINKNNNFNNNINNINNSHIKINSCGDYCKLKENKIMNKQEYNNIKLELKKKNEVVSDSTINNYLKKEKENILEYPEKNARTMNNKNETLDEYTENEIDSTIDEEIDNDCINKKNYFLYIKISDNVKFKKKLINSKPKKLISGTSCNHGCVLFENKEIYFWIYKRGNLSNISNKYDKICNDKKSNYIIFKKLKSPKLKIIEVVYCNNTYIMLSEDRNIYILKLPFLKNLRAVNFFFYLNNYLFKKTNFSHNTGMLTLDKIKKDDLIKMYLTDYILITIHNTKDIYFTPILFENIYNYKDTQYIDVLSTKYEYQIRNLIKNLGEFNIYGLEKLFSPEEKMRFPNLTKYKMIRICAEKKNSFTLYVSPNALIVCIYNLFEYYDILNSSISNFLSKYYIV
ncbi:conserved Plasmodium protein, unknown function [Plasmodium gallinaceum]|uniref:Uncharacterized protein n=1 Tax=Plasmodium gallinaceum TaxID=5849 RepID=A0A1J1GXU7_PLAGA|nr:conserved Plasmodium protein, unknown function [Plasmodium gallinaceum]CRG97304.1 conserved Plasmodium protein, unknown function [Plasmodium gallinaceum]